MRNLIVAHTNAEHAKWALALKHHHNWESKAQMEAYYTEMLFRAELVLRGCELLDVVLTPRKAEFR